MLPAAWRALRGRSVRPMPQRFAAARPRGGAQEPRLPGGSWLPSLPCVIHPSESWSRRLRGSVAASARAISRVALDKRKGKSRMTASIVRGVGMSFILKMDQQGKAERVRRRLPHGVRPVKTKAERPDTRRLRDTPCRNWLGAAESHLKAALDESCCTAGTCDRRLGNGSKTRSDPSSK